MYNNYYFDDVGFCVVGVKASFCWDHQNGFDITNDGQLLISALESHVDITSKHLCCYFTVLMSYHNHRLNEFVVCRCFWSTLFSVFFFWFFFW